MMPMSDLLKNQTPDTENSLVLFTAPSWCVPCRQFGPVFAKAAEEHKGGTKFYYVDIDEEPELAREYDVMSVPTVVRLVDGEREDITERSPIKFIKYVNSI